MIIRTMRRLAVVAAVTTMALAGACDGDAGGTGSTGTPGPGGTGAGPGGSENTVEAPPAQAEGLWMVPDQYASGAGGDKAGGMGGGGMADGDYAAGEATAGGWDDSGMGGAPADPAPGEAGGGGGGGGEAGGANGAWEPEVTAGVADDNASFEDFLTYLDEHSSLPNTLPIDISERYTLHVTSGGSAIPNARVRIRVGEDVVFDGKSLATGDLLFHPWAAGVAAEATAFSWQVDSAAGTATGSFDRSSGGSIDLEAAGANPKAEKVRADVALIVDTTGSMGDEIAVLRDTWLKITAEINALDPNLDARFALVIYRDRGDAYVVKYLDFTSDVQEFLAALEDVQADGGGDFPEDLQAALDVTSQYLSWDDAAPIRIAFTLADAPPQLYEQEITYPESLARAVHRGIRMHAIAASGSDESAELCFRQFAQFTSGRFLFLTYANDIPGKPGSGTGSGGEDGYSVEQYLTGTLDELVVKLVNLDVLALTGSPLPQPE